MIKQTSEQQACTKRRVEVYLDDLPLACPPRVDRVWDAHPRVYLPIETAGAVVCPYCDTEFVLKASPAEQK
tara:strand:+ start:168 stop:380 length:213 start_codon:yes stop_codon:yes gene_type:complete